MHRTYTILATIALGLVVAGSAVADTYTLDPAHTQISFKVKHLGITTVTGKFDRFSGTFEFDPKNIEAGSTSVSIDVSSVDTGIEARDNHLRTSDFFDVENHPLITFKSAKIRNVKDDKFQIIGDLTIRGVTKPVTLDVEFDGTATDPGGTEKAAFTATTEIDRMDFGVSWNKVLDAGGLVASKEVKIILEVEGDKVKG
jgi:polyisoprenoid-binding protein YceI